jgi:replicative DNA helicase
MTTAMRVPYDADAEQAVIGALLVDAACIPAVQRLVTAADFYRAAHRYLFGAVGMVVSRGEVPDRVTVLAQLEQDGSTVAAGGHDYLDRLVDQTFTTANVEVHARRVADVAARRRLLELGQSLALDAALGAEPPVALAAGAMAALMPIAAPSRAAAGFVRVSEDRAGLVAELTAPPPPDGLVGVPTGWPAVDVMTSGFLGGELVVFVAVPGGGKTVALINVATHNAIRSAVTRPVGFVSAEMTRRALQKRILCDLAEIDSLTMRRRTFNDIQGRRLARAVDQLTAAPLWIDETPAPDVPTLFAKIRALKAEVPDLALVCVDYLQLLSGMNEENRAETLRAISNGLKALAKELRIPVFTAAQVNDKQTEKRTDGSKRPRLDDLQGSSGIRQAADAVAILHRPKLYGDSVHDLVEMNWAKMRELAPTMVTLEAELEYQRIVPARFAVPMDGAA